MSWKIVIAGGFLTAIVGLVKEIISGASSWHEELICHALVA